MKKLTALLLVLVMFVSMVPTVYAEEEISAAAKACVTLGMLKGTNGTVDTAYTRMEPSRMQVAIMFLRLKGLEDQALAYSGTSNFNDKDQVAWATGKAVMAYLKAHPEHGWIGNNGNFNPNAMMSAQAYYKILLETLGYTQETPGKAGDFTWNTTLEFAASKGLKKAAKAIPFTVDDMAVATIEVLKAKLRGSTKTLAEDLVEKGVLDKVKAAEAGVIAAPIVFAIDKVQVMNLTEIKVIFTDKVDKVSAENIKNYSIDEHPISSALVQQDGKSVVLRLDIDESPAEAVAFEQGEEFVLKLSEIYNADKTKSVDSYKTAMIEASDVAMPTAEKLELVGPYKVKVIFNEPIKSTSEAIVEINNGTYEAVVEEADGSNAIFITLNDTLSEGSYSLTISKVKDYAGYSSMKRTLSLSYKRVTSAPTVSIVSSEESQVVVQFNRPVFDENEEALDGNYFYHTVSSIHPDVTTKDNQTFVLDFSNEPLPEGNVRFVVVYKVDGSAITDEWGNEMKSNVILNLNIVADKVKPAVTSVKVENEQTLALYFSENINVDTAIDRSNYIVMDDNDKNVDIANADYVVKASSNEYIVKLIFEEKLSGTYTLEVSGIKDLAAEPNSFATKTFIVVVKDEAGIDLRAVTATTVEGSGSIPDYIYITFPEEMTTEGQYGILNKENYLLSNNEGDTFETLSSLDSVSLMTGTKTVKLTIKDNSDYDVDDDGFRVSIARVADKAGNKSALFAATINPTPDEPIAAISFVAVDTRTVEVTFDGRVKTAPTSGFRISKNGGTASAPTDVKLRYEDVDQDGNDETIASLTLKTSQQFTDSDAQGILEINIMAKTIRSETGLFCDESEDNAVTDGIPPTITDIEQTGSGRITISFDEDIAITNAGLGSTDLVIRDKNSKTLVAGVDYNITVDSSSLTIVLIGNYDDYTGRMTIDTKDKVMYIFDEDGEHAKLKAYGTPKALTLD